MLHCSPPVPHARLVVPDWQTPLTSQQPEAHVVALHAGFGIGEPQPRSNVAKHRVKQVQRTEAVMPSGHRRECRTCVGFPGLELPDDADETSAWLVNPRVWPARFANRRPALANTTLTTAGVVEVVLAQSLASAAEGPNTHSASAPALRPEEQPCAAVGGGGGLFSELRARGATRLPPRAGAILRRVAAPVRRRTHAAGRGAHRWRSTRAAVAREPRAARAGVRTALPGLATHGNARARATRAGQARATRTRG